jgi:hypothetical protein
MRTDVTWDSHLTLSVRRTSDGVGGGAISGGDSYLPLGTGTSTFFSGTGDRLNIQMQLRLDGVSASVPANSYATTITFTVVDL